MQYAPKVVGFILMGIVPLWVLYIVNQQSDTDDTQTPER
jgi:hypothetical protein